MVVAFLFLAMMLRFPLLFLGFLFTLEYEPSRAHDASLYFKCVIEQQVIRMKGAKYQKTEMNVERRVDVREGTIQCSSLSRK